MKESGGGLKEMLAISYVGCWKEQGKHDKLQSGQPMTPVMLVQMLYSCSQKRLRNLVNKIMLLRMPRKIRDTLTKTNDGWIHQKAFVRRSSHFLTFSSLSVGVFGQTICRKGGRTSTKYTPPRLPRFCYTCFNFKKKLVV